MSYSLLNKRWRPAEFLAYLSTLQRPKWAKGVTLHHTASPSLAQRPSGLSPQHMENIADFYRNKLGWSAGPHLFVDQHHIIGMSPLDEKGTHARSFNSTHIGIEVLGDYDSEDPNTGHGRLSWSNAAIATSCLLKWLGLPDSAFNFHRDDPKTNKTCPGRKVTRGWVLGLMQERVGPAHVDIVKVTDVVTSAKIAKIHTGFLVNGVRVETAFYDPAEKATMASRQEMARLGLL